jgi:hypothetical protein
MGIARLLPGLVREESSTAMNKNFPLEDQVGTQ